MAFRVKRLKTRRKRKVTARRKRSLGIRWSSPPLSRRPTICRFCVLMRITPLPRRCETCHHPKGWRTPATTVPSVVEAPTNGRTAKRRPKRTFSTTGKGALRTGPVKRTRQSVRKSYSKISSSHSTRES